MLPAWSPWSPGQLQAKESLLPLAHRPLPPAVPGQRVTGPLVPPAAPGQCVAGPLVQCEEEERVRAVVSFQVPGPPAGHTSICPVYFRCLRFYLGDPEAGAYTRSHGRH